jgi:hypothetical protein
MFVYDIRSIEMKIKNSIRILCTLFAYVVMSLMMKHQLDVTIMIDGWTTFNTIFCIMSSIFVYVILFIINLIVCLPVLSGD